MKLERSEVVLGGQRRGNNQRAGSGSNWVLIVGGALLSAVSVRLLCKLKESFDGKQSDGSVNAKPAHHRKRRSIISSLDADSYYGLHDGECCCQYAGGISNPKQTPCSPISKNSDNSLQLVTVPAMEANKDTPAIMWISSPEDAKPLHRSGSPESPSASESGSDILNKRDVIQKMRQQLKRQDEMIIDLQVQILELQDSLNSQMSHASNLQIDLDTVNHLLFDSKLQIQQLRKSLSDRCLAGSVYTEGQRKWQLELNGQANGYFSEASGKEIHCVSLEKPSDNGRVEILKGEVGDLKDVIEGKEFLIRSYKEQKLELHAKINELQRTLASQTPTTMA